MSDLVVDWTDLSPIFETFFKEGWNPFRSYVADTCPQPMVLFRASEDLDEQDPSDPTLGWNMVSPQVEVRVVPGNHDTMMAEPHVRVLAEQLRACLDRAAS